MRTFSDIVDNLNYTIDILKNRYFAEMLPFGRKISAALNIFSDEESKDLYAREIMFLILRMFVKGDFPSIYAGLLSSNDFKKAVEDARNLEIFSTIKAPSDSNVTDYCLAATFILEQYRYKNKVMVNSGDICLDIGACIGDTSIYMLQSGAKDVFSFEIDRRNIECMCQNLLPFEGRAHIKSEALSNKKGILYYQPANSNIGAGKLLSVQNAISSNCYEVKVTTIDDFCDEEGIIPTFIKMDIEGSELDALHGGVRTLINARPKLAVCIYHTVAHRWEIPLFLHELLPDYEFYLKKSHPIWETVLLACPPPPPHTHIPIHSNFDLIFQSLLLVSLTIYFEVEYEA